MPKRVDVNVYKCPWCFAYNNGYVLFSGEDYTYGQKLDRVLIICNKCHEGIRWANTTEKEFLRYSYIPDRIYSRGEWEKIKSKRKMPDSAITVSVKCKHKKKHGKGWSNKNCPSSYIK